MENMDCTKMDADSLDENTPNAPEFICPICLPMPKSSGFQWKKKPHWVSVVRGYEGHHFHCFLSIRNSKKKEYI